ncbi:MAG: Fe-S cluster assembly protein HesB [Actinobacteria bacterium]|nr:Fe-S cluster assembly protein HesB [Actinomycetota bacterium]
MAAPSFFVTGDADADAFLATDPLALVVGMLLDQQIPIESAFAAPRRLADRLAALDVAWEAGAIAAVDASVFLDVFGRRPALHRFPRAMATRVQAMCAAVAEDLDGDVARLWRTASDGATLHAALCALPGFGDEKARILLAVLAKRFGVRPSGWQDACAPFGDDQPRTVADICDPTSLQAVRAWKKAQRAAGRTKADPTAAVSTGAPGTGSTPGRAIP